MKKTKRNISRWLKAQFARPAGLWGAVAGTVMAHRSSNRERARWTLELLDLHPGDRVLEVGFGPGVAIDYLVRSTEDVVVVGVDHSEVMLRQARRRNANAVTEGRVSLHLAPVEVLPAFEDRFHKIFTINSVDFWRDPVARLARLGELLVPGGGAGADGTATIDGR